MTSIEVPASDPKASEVFFLVNNMQAEPVYVDELLRNLAPGAPLLLLWGEADPWIVPSRVRSGESSTLAQHSKISGRALILLYRGHHTCKTGILSYNPSLSQG